MCIHFNIETRKKNFIKFLTESHDDENGFFGDEIMAAIIKFVFFLRPKKL